MTRTAEATVAAGALTWANLVSLLRIPLAAAMFVADSATARAAIIVAAAASDYIDGWLARRLRQGSRLGEMLDPVTDKVFVLAAILAAAVQRLIEPWAVALLLARDVLITVGALIAIGAGWRIRLRARFSGKVVTTLQLATVLALAVAPSLAMPGVIATAAATVWAIADYSLFASRSLRGASTAG
jgi:CDP-diacylglycerol--glycerol-3-phosphate 3-phosphatidyltransferase/cardiolipin synthase